MSKFRIYSIQLNSCWVQYYIGKNMNSRQFAIILLGLAIFLCAELFPPWLYVDKSLSGARRRAGYHYVKNPPVKNRTELEQIFEIPAGYPQQEFAIEKDKGLIDGQRIAIILGGLSLALLLRQNSKLYIRILGWITLVAFLGVCGLIVFYLYYFRPLIQ